MGDKYSARPIYLLVPLYDWESCQKKICNRTSLSGCQIYSVEGQMRLAVYRRSLGRMGLLL